MDCTRIDSDGEFFGEALSCRVVTARKEHICCECRLKINKDERYERSKLVYDGKIREFKTCINCISLRDAFFDSWSFGSIWKEFYKYVSEGYGDQIKWSALSELTDTAKNMALCYIEMFLERIEKCEKYE